MHFSPDEVAAARETVYARLPPTPQYAWPMLRERLGFPVWVKHENHTPAGAFKVRGGLTYFAALVREQPGVRGVVSATRGNHGQSVGLAARRTGWRRPSWCRTATRARRTRPCAPWASRWSSTATTSRPRANTPSASRSARGCTWCRPSIATWCSGVMTYWLEFFESFAPGERARRRVRAHRPGLRVSAPRPRPARTPARRAGWSAWCRRMRPAYLDSFRAGRVRRGAGHDRAGRRHGLPHRRRRGARRSSCAKPTTSSP